MQTAAVCVYGCVSLFMLTAGRPTGMGQASGGSAMAHRIFKQSAFAQRSRMDCLYLPLQIDRAAWHAAHGGTNDIISGVSHAAGWCRVASCCWLGHTFSLTQIQFILRVVGFLIFLMVCNAARHG